MEILKMIIIFLKRLLISQPKLNEEEDPIESEIVKPKLKKYYPLIQAPSIYYNDRKSEPELIVIHWLGVPGGMKMSLKILNERKLSCHYCICEDGTRYKLVDEEKRAWHAGTSNHPLFPNAGRSLNGISIGIELEGPPSTKGWTEWPKPMLESAALLCKDIATRFPIKGIVDHYSIAPDRKVDVLKGEGVNKFPWNEFIEMTTLKDLT